MSAFDDVRLSANYTSARPPYNAIYSFMCKSFTFFFLNVFVIVGQATNFMMKSRLNLSSITKMISTRHQKLAEKLHMMKTETVPFSYLQHQSGQKSQISFLGRGISCYTRFANYD